ncbi:MAG: DUF1697 domain-containing protein, partial [Ornithinimicrobium sp.]
MADVVALLRSVNVGGNRMKMDWLRALATDVGCRDVRTVVATGNIVMSPPDDIEATGQELERALAEHFGKIAVIMRTHEELRSGVARNPWAEQVESGDLEGRAVHTMFCDAPPPATVVEVLQPTDSDDEFAVSQAEVYLKLAGSAADTRFTGSWFERHLGVTGTMRNHNTVL